MVDVEESHIVHTHARVYTRTRAFASERTNERASERERERERRREQRDARVRGDQGGLLEV
jgi:TFIIF-interacting CTD phosphatase-like protein